MLPAKSKEKLTTNPSLSKRSEQEDLNTELLKSLLCTSSSCNNYVYTPVKQCRSGHILCFKCADQICPECGTPIIKARNIALEKIAEKLLVACINHPQGCSQAMPRGFNMVVHEFQCPFRMYKCFAAKCSWTGRSNEVLLHIETNHKERVIIGSEKEFKIKKLDNRSELDMTFLFSCEHGNFWAKFIFKKKEAIFLGAVQYIGKIESSNTFKYVFEISSSDNFSEKVFKYSRKTHADVMSFETIFESSDCLSVPLQVMKYFADDNVVTVKLNIENNN